MTAAEIVQSYEIINERLEPALGERPMRSDSTAPEIDVHLYLDDAGLKVPMWEFHTNVKSLRSLKPVSVNISKGQAYYFAESETLGIYTTGESQNVAIKEFVEQIVYFYEYYSKLPQNKVTGRAQTLKELYDKEFEELA